MISSILYACALLTALTLAFVRGSDPERRVAAVLLTGNLATIGALFVGQGQEFSYVSVAYLSVDIVGAMALCAIAIWHPSWMTILVATFQINGTLGHAVKLMSPETIDVSYAILLRLWGWPMVLTLIASRLYPSLRRLLRQSDLLALPRAIRPPLTPAGLLLKELNRANGLNRIAQERDVDVLDQEALEKTAADSLRSSVLGRTQKSA